MQAPVALLPWCELIGDAQHRCAISLPEPLESYLVFLLIRFYTRVDWVGSILGLEFLNAAQTGGSSWRDVGDKCLIFSGLFPKDSNTCLA